MRFERTALYAHEHGFDVITSCLGISRWKNMQQINDCGERAAARYDDVTYWTFNWRKQGGSSRMVRAGKTRTVLPARILRMYLFLARHQPMASQKRPQTHRNRRPILRLGRPACRRTPAVDTASIVRRALCATLRLPRAQNAHATSVVDITAMPYVAPLARHQIPPVRKMRTLRYRFNSPEDDSICARTNHWNCSKSPS